MVTYQGFSRMLDLCVLVGIHRQRVEDLETLVEELQRCAEAHTDRAAEVADLKNRLEDQVWLFFLLSGRGLGTRYLAPPSFAAGHALHEHVFSLCSFVGLPVPVSGSLVWTCPACACMQVCAVFGLVAIFQP